jgi:hypothetical protein
MTMQTPERLHYRGRVYSIDGQPLSDCTDPWVRTRMQRFTMTRTDVHRGYLGTWAIRRDRLWLVDLKCWVEVKPSPDAWSWDERGLDFLFPSAEGAVIADWFSGELTAGVGTPTRARMYGRVWPRLRVFQVDRGAVIGSTVRDNRKAYAEAKRRTERLFKHLDELVSRDAGP